MALKPITRQEKIIAGQNLTPITRMEKFLKQFGGDGGDLLETVAMEVPLEITWDGNIEGKEMMDTGNGNETFFVKISDMILTKEQVLNAVAVSLHGEEIILTEDKILDLSSQGIPAILCGSFILAANSDFDVGDGIVHPSGLYFYYVDSDSYVTHLTCPNATTTITKQQIKTELLPEGYPYEDSFSYTNSAYKEGDELVGGVLFKVSDDTPSYEDLLGAKFITEGGAEPEGELTSDNTRYVEGEITDAQIGFNRNIIVTYKDNLDISGDGSVIIPTKGVYMSVGYNITISKNRITTIAPKFLPKITIVEDGYADAAAGVAMVAALNYTCTANVTFEELLQALQNKNVPMVELYYHGHGDGVIGVAKGGTTYFRVETDGNIKIYQEFYINGGYLLVTWKANGEIELIPNI